MAIVTFAKVLPGGNSTILVESPIPAMDRPAVANALMSPAMLSAEQVGFLVTPPKGMDARLEMMGGELCVNALRSLSALLFHRDSTKSRCLLSTSGTTDPVVCENKRGTDGNIFTTLTLELRPDIEWLEDGCDLVRLDGIAHILRRVSAIPTPEKLRSLFDGLQKKYKDRLASFPAFGIIPFREEGETIEIFPIVYVRQTDTTVFETGCGSGSIAIALRMNPSPSRMLSIRQPSGYCYNLSVVPTATGVAVHLGSAVRILAEGTAFLSPDQS